MNADLYAIGKWWMALMFFGFAGWPLVAGIFPRWEDKGYLMAKAMGLVAVTYLVWISGSFRLIPYSSGEMVFWGLILGGGGLILKYIRKTRFKINWKLILAEELLFMTFLTGWAWIKAHDPTINGLEKFMDYGFTMSIQRTTFFPPKDMWFAGEGINYYYFGHLVMASVSLLSGVEMAVGFNLMLATLFALCLTMSFGIGRELLHRHPPTVRVAGAFLTALLVTLAGNLHTIYAFTKGYWGNEDNPPPFWEIMQPVWDKSKLAEGLASYWYPNATRFIPYTIHEFPSYSFVVSDIHGHVLSIPIVLLLIALLVTFFDKDHEIELWQAGVYGLIAAAAFMTNALDGPIYAALFGLLFIAKETGYSFNKLKTMLNPGKLKRAGLVIAVVGGVFVLSALPFLTQFKPFVNGVAVNCPPAFLADRKIGPLIFEGTEKCQKSPVWMMLILWGFFLYNGLALWKLTKEDTRYKKALLVWSIFSFGLIVFAEFFYFKDIYPQHFRSNTMFKLGYQAFILLSLLSGYTIVQVLEQRSKKIWTKAYLAGLVPLLFLVMIYPYFSVKSYFNGLKEYQGLYGLEWMKTKYPGYYSAVEWLNKNVRGQPVILEAAGESYTDYDMVSAFTGLPTVGGWTVHEWLWRGEYGPIALRDMEIADIYQSADEVKTSYMMQKYKVKYIIVGDMERKKYPDLDEAKFSAISKLVFSQNSTRIYELP